MDNIIQIERSLYSKICGARRLFDDLWMTALKNLKTWNHKGHWAPFCSSAFFQKQLSKIIMESSSSKISQNSVENTRGRLLF